MRYNSVLFLDELPEFRRNVLEVMRQPARSVQLQRFQKRNIHANAQMGARDIKRYCSVNDDAERLLETGVVPIGTSILLPYIDTVLQNVD